MTNSIISSGYNNETHRYERRMADGSIQVRVYFAFDGDGEEQGFGTDRDAVCGLCQDAAREADSDGAEYTVEERWIDATELA